MLDSSMVEIADAILGFSLMFVGIAGYSLQPPPEYVGSERAIASMCLYYSVLALFLVAETLCDIVRCEASYLRIFEIAFMLLLLFVTLYGLKVLRKIWMFKIDRVRDCLLYGCVVYLMDKQAFSKIVVYPILLNLILLILAIWLVILLGYILLKYRKIRFFIAFEDYQLVSIAYMTTFFIGLCAMNGAFTETLPYALTIIINVYALYIIITKYVKPLL